MNVPRRFIDSPGSPWVRELLRAGEAERPPQRSRRRALAFTAAALASTAATTAAQGSAAAWLGSLVAKWIGVGLVAGTVAAVGLRQASTLRFGHGNGQSAALSPTGAAAERSKSTSAPAVRVSKAAVTSDFPAAVASRSAPRESADRSGPASAPEGAAKASTLARELGMVDDARRALARGQGRSALEFLRRYRSAFPEGHFAPETQALEVEAWAMEGDVGRARAQAESFLQSYPSSPLSERVRALVAH